MLNSINEFGKYKCKDCSIYNKCDITVRKNKYCKIVSREVKKDSNSCMGFIK
jgi:hypothetical protein